jgi:anti-sigma factor ChrR (cupin superfamily)
MLINADFGARVVLRLGDVGWVPSPAAGVERRMLDRVGAEVARATSFVRYAPGSTFPTHLHGGGEEFLVLEGTFSDEFGDYPAGTYVRNPVGSAHAPRSDGGCTIFVKLHQADPADQAHIVVRTREARFLPGPVPGLAILPLHRVGNEETALERWAPGLRFTRPARAGGLEVLVLDGTFEDEHGLYPAGTWLRAPPLSTAPASTQGCLIWVRTGHLPPP